MILSANTAQNYGFPFTTPPTVSRFIGPYKYFETERFATKKAQSVMINV
jgi:hypothetical protein